MTPHKVAEQLFASEGSLESVQQLVFKAVQKSNISCLQNVVISGGSTMFQGFVERLQEELTALFEGQKVHVFGLEDRTIAAFVGGSILAALKAFEPHWITKEEYAQQGAAIVAKKCE